MPTRTTLLRAIYDGFLDLTGVPTATVRLQRYTEQDTNVIVLGDLGGRAHEDDIPDMLRVQRVQVACYHQTPETARAWAQAVYEAFMTFSEGDGTVHPWTLTGWSVAQVRVDPPRELGRVPSDSHQRAKVTVEVTLICPVMTSLS